MAFDALKLLEQAGAAFTGAQDDEAVRDLAEEQDAENRAVRLAENAEQLALANRAMGNPIGEMQRSQAKFDGCRDKVAGLKEQLRKAEEEMRLAGSSVQFWADRMVIVDEAASRSRIPDPLEEASARAADAMRQHREGQMVVERAKREQRAWWSQ